MNSHSITKLLESGRKSLLDLSARNRMINLGKEGRGLIEIVKENSQEIYTLLVEGKKSLGLVPKETEDTEKTEASEPKPDGLEPKKPDNKLNTNLEEKDLFPRLLHMMKGAKTALEERGTNALFLILGRLIYKEAEHSKIQRSAPLIMIPVKLERKEIRNRFDLSYTGEELRGNIAISEKLFSEMGLKIPSFNPQEDEIGEFLKPLEDSVKLDGWEVQKDYICLTFIKDLSIWTDTNPSTWISKDNDSFPSIFKELLETGFQVNQDDLDLDLDIDKDIPVASLDHVVDADGYQTKAIEAVRQGKSIIIQGPPGTGKSQTIVNIIATSVLDGKKVLFVAQKEPALKVVQARLNKEGIGDICLNLHGTRGVRKEILEEIKRTWELGNPKGKDESIIEDLSQKRDRLNSYAKAVNQKHSHYGLSYHEVIGFISLLKEKNPKLVNDPIMLSWSKDNLEKNIQLLENWNILNNSLKNSPKFLELIGRTKVLGPERITLLANLDEAITNLNSLSKAYNEAFSGDYTPTWTDIERASQISEVVNKFDHLFKENLEGLLENEKRIKELLKNNLEVETDKKDIEEKLRKPIKEQNVREIEGILTRIRDRINSLWRWFYSDYRLSVNEAKLLFVNPPDSGKELERLLEKVLCVIEKVFTQSEAIKKLGEELQIRENNLTQLEKNLKDIQEVRKVLSLGTPEFLAIKELTNDNLRLSSLNKIPNLHEKTIQGIADIKEILSFNHEFNLTINDSKILLESIKNDISLIETRCRFNLLAKELEANSLLNLSTQVEAKGLSQNVIADCVRFSYFTAVAKQILSELPELENFDAKNHQELIKEFKSLDLERLKQSKIKVLEKHQSNLPARQGGIGITGMLMEEVEVKRGGRPIRKIMEAGAEAIQRIKPVFMMSPTSVAQYLPNKEVKFDLLIIDEASQVKPMEVLGCFGRCKQYVVVGDSKQLPPTDFFNKIIDSPEIESEEDFGVREAKEMESILSLCSARGMPEKYLNWHYRSRHPSLIALSNREFYDNRLWIIPSPHKNHKDLGLKFTKIENGLYGRGGSTDNIPEAKKVVGRLKELAKANDPRSILVATLSVSQRDAIDNLLEIERQSDPTLNEYLNRNENEPFTVKNLESVQGDERDIVLISIGYGKDSNNKLHMDFGPISREGGERRLNVLMTRARELCEVYSSISASEINLGKATGRGALILKEFLAYAENGVMYDFSTPKGETMSPFEESVKQKIESHGHEVHTQVGEAGFFIDLAIVCPKNQGEYILGIECDGASYHSSLSARDRDRLRQQVLEDKGWKLHRIWSTDWFERETQELNEILEKIHNSQEIVKEKITHTIERDSSNIVSSFSTPYIKFENTLKLKGSELIENIIRVEGPIHKDEVTKRYSYSLGLAKTGSKTKMEVNTIILKMIYNGTLDSEGENMDWVWIRDQTIPIRNRSEVEYSLRKPEFLPPCEIRKTIEVCVKECHGATREELEKSVPKQLGVSSASQLVRSIVSKEIDRMIHKVKLAEKGGILKIFT